MVEAREKKMANTKAEKHQRSGSNNILASFPRPALTHICKPGKNVARTIEINGRAFEVPVVTLPDSKRVKYWPGELIFTVYERRKGQWISLGAMAKLEPAQRLMEKSGRAMTLSIEYSSFPASVHFRFRIALISKRDAPDLRIQYMGHSYPAEVNQCST